MRKYFKSLLFLIAPQVIFATVTAKVDNNTIELGEMVTYSLNISGENIIRPNIQRLCDSDIISTSAKTSMQMINGDISKNYILSYKFIPQNSCKIDAIELDINGKKEKSNSVEIKVKPVSAATDNEFVLELKSSKKNVYVGETFDVNLMFKQKKDSRAVDSKFIPPTLKGFWIKNESDPVREESGEYVVTKLTYTVAAQRAGVLDITKAQMRIASRENKVDSWGSFIPSVKWKTYFSNELSIDVKALPNKVKLVGDFSISVKTDKKEVNANEPVNIKIEVAGRGNLEDIESFKTHIDEVSVFDEKININGEKLTQNIAFVGENDFTIPAFSLRYFDLKSKKVKTITTQAIDIKVKNATVKKELNIKREQTTGKDIEVTTSANNGYDKFTLVGVFIVGLIVGIILMLLKSFNFSKKEKKVSLKDPKNLLMKLFPYKDDKDVQSIVDMLEEGIYSGKKLELNKKALKDILKRYEID